MLERDGARVGGGTVSEPRHVVPGAEPCLVAAVVASVLYVGRAGAQARDRAGEHGQARRRRTVPPVAAHAVARRRECCRRGRASWRESRGRRRSPAAGGVAIERETAKALPVRDLLGSPPWSSADISCRAADRGTPTASPASTSAHCSVWCNFRPRAAPTPVRVFIHRKLTRLADGRRYVGAVRARARRNPDIRLWRRPVEAAHAWLVAA